MSFRYLVVKLESGEAQKMLVRAVNFRPYEQDAAARIQRRLQSELEACGFDPDQDLLEIEGGGTVVVNPYYETATLFGEDPTYGAESDRAAVAALLGPELGGFEIKIYLPGEEEAPAKAKPKPKPKPGAATPKARPSKPTASNSTPVDQAQDDETEASG